MRILLIHRTFPGQFRYLATALAQDPCNEVIFLTSAEQGEIPGVKKMLYTPHRPAHPSTHTYLQTMESAVIYGQAAYKTALQLKKDGFIPDVIYGHSGWGPTLFMADLFPRSPLVCHFEWFYRSHGSSFGFDPANPLTIDNEAEIRIKNAPILFDLTQSSLGISPTEWQRRQFPAEFQSKITVIHEGIHCGFFSPLPGTKLVLQKLGLDLSQVEEIVTYVATGMEPLRGFPQFMAAAAEIQRRKPGCHIVVVGEDRTEYSNTLTGGKTYRQDALERHSYDLSRLHFTGRLSIPDYLTVLRSSAVHVYLTYPFILSWSVLEAMACGSLIVASDTLPVREIIEDNVNGLLVDFFDPFAIADRVIEALSKPGWASALKSRARETILAKYELDQLLARQITLLQNAAAKGV